MNARTVLEGPYLILQNYSISWLKKQQKIPISVYVNVYTIPSFKYRKVMAKVNQQCVANRQWSCIWGLFYIIYYEVEEQIQHVSSY